MFIKKANGFALLSSQKTCLANNTTAGKNSDLKNEKTFCENLIFIYTFCQ